jgi:serine/threonine-protein kinase
MEKNLRKYSKIFSHLLGVILFIAFNLLTTAYGAPSNLVKVPNVVNVSMDQATQSLKNAGLGVSVKSLPVDNPKYNNMVTLQSHKPGDLVTKNTAITITVLKYTPPANLVKVPNVLNISMDQATQSLKNAGLGVSVKTLSVDNPKYNNMVKIQSHKPGDLVQKGTVVTISVLRFPTR